jgi:hypothetical protein
MIAKAQTCRKLLVSFDPSVPEGSNGGFVVPIAEDDKVFLFDLKSKRQTEYAVMVFVGRDITVNDLFAKLVDSGRYISDVEKTVSMLSQYVESLVNFKIGNVLSVNNASPYDGIINLKKIADTPSGAIKILG